MIGIEFAEPLITPAGGRGRIKEEEHGARRTSQSSRGRIAERAALDSRQQGASPWQTS
jgi:hypothetical protein